MKEDAAEVSRGQVPESAPATASGDVVGAGQGEGAISQRRLLGAYYTPSGVADLLVRWALDGTVGRVLDPSYGGAAFLHAAAEELSALGCATPGGWVFGVDVDPACALPTEGSGLLESENCLIVDFLSLSRSDLSWAPFRAVVGNPPYVRHHWVKGEARSTARRVVLKDGSTLPGTASLWAYFVIHSLSFIEVEGRLAFLVPEAILQADYAAVVRSTLVKRFRRVRLIHLRERLFEGTDEAVVALLAEGYGTRGSLSVSAVDTVAELRRVMQGDAVTPPRPTLSNGRRILPEAMKVLEDVASSGDTKCFGTIARSRIGVVTGANTHFIRTVADLDALGIPPEARAGIVARTRWLSGLDFTPVDYAALSSSGARATLVAPPSTFDGHPGVARWIEEGEQAGIHRRYKCAGRTPWFRVNVAQRPDAFVSSMRRGPPLLTLNRTSCQCTNAMNAVWFHEPEVVAANSVALGFLTTSVALWAELNGRRYGGGALKLDLSALSRLPLPLVPIESGVFDTANRALREGDEATARSVADEAVLGRGIGMSIQAIEALQRALRELAADRAPLPSRS